MTRAGNALSSCDAGNFPLTLYIRYVIIVYIFGGCP